MQVEMWQVDGKGGSDRLSGLQEWGSDLVGCEAVFVAEGVPLAPVC